MRVNLKLIAAICLALIPYLIFWRRCSDVEKDQNFFRERYLLERLAVENTDEKNSAILKDEKKSNYYGGYDNSENDGDHPNDSIMEDKGPSVKDIDCLINGEYTVACHRDTNDEIYMPFSFIAKYFEVYGSITAADGYDRFEWQHSHSRVYTPTEKYTPQGVFMSFEHYNVEVRDRVKCITGMDGVPLSTQWGPEGYYYPIQIAQYGLSHYSRYLVSDQDKDPIVLDDMEKGLSDKWSHRHGAKITRIKLATHVMELNTKDAPHDDTVLLRVDSTSRFFLSMDFCFTTNGSFTVYVEPKGKHPETYAIHYVQSSNVISVSDNDIYYGIGERHHWSRITRDIATDFHKGLALRYSTQGGNNGQKKKTSKKALHKIVKISFTGVGQVDNITLSKTAHLAQFYYAANWLVMNQDERGGWPNMVNRRLAGGMLTLDPGWYSAMAQGQAMSLLTRAYLRTGNNKYLDCAVRATHLFSVPSSSGGILARFLDQFDWYEEYPTTPSSFVLNGFIYSLIGLYDLKEVASGANSKAAGDLYDSGMRTLKRMLPLFDTGTGSVYDLRHFTLGVAPNIARWDYHATHINQLLLLATIQVNGENAIFGETANRWMDYMKGKRASHN